MFVADFFEWLSSEGRTLRKVIWVIEQWRRYAAQSDLSDWAVKAVRCAKWSEWLSSLRSTLRNCPSSIVQCMVFWAVEFSTGRLGTNHQFSVVFGLALLFAKVGNSWPCHANKHPPLATSPHSVGPSASSGNSSTDQSHAIEMTLCL